MFFIIFHYSNVFFQILHQISYPGMVSDRSDMKNIEKSLFHIYVILVPRVPTLSDWVRERVASAGAAVLIKLQLYTSTFM